MAEIKEMTVAQAWRIVTQMSPSSSDFEKASSFLKANYPDLWLAYVKYGSEFMASKEKEQAKEVEITPEAMAHNHEEIEKLAAQYDFEEFKAQEEHQKLLANVEVLDDADDKKPASIVNVDRQNDYMSLLFAAAQMKAHVSLLGDQAFTEGKDKAGMYKDRVDNIFYTDLARAGVASVIKAPNEKESKLDSKSFKNWVERNSKKARDVLARLIDGKEKVTVRTSSLATSLGASQAQADLFEKRMQARASQEKGDSKSFLDAVVKGFKANSEKRREKIKDFWNKPFSEKVETSRNFFREAWENNKVKTATNVVVGVAFAATLFSNPVTAAAGLGTYIAAGGWVWPVHTERKRIQNEAKKAGKPVPSNKEARRLAWQNLTSKERINSYMAQGIASTVIGGAAAVALPMIAAGAAVEGAGIAAGLTAGKMARIGAPAVGQLCDASITALARPHDSVAQANAQVTALGAIATLGAGWLTTEFLDGASYSATPATDVQVDATAPINTMIPTDTVASSYVPGSVDGELNEIINSLAPAEETTPMLDFPDQYTPATGLTQKQFNTLVRTSPGVFGPLAHAAGMTDAQYMDLIYTNIHQHMDKFPGLTEEQVLYDANRMIAFHAKATNVGGGFLDNIDTGADHLNNEFSKMSFFKNNWSEDKIAAFAEDMQYYTYSSKQEVLSALEQSYSDIPLATRKAICNALVGNRVAYVNGPQIEALQAMIMGCNPDERYIQSAADLVRQHVNSHYDYLRPENGTGNRYIGGYGTDADCGNGIGRHRWATGGKIIEREPVDPISPVKPTIRRIPVAPIDTVPVVPVDTVPVVPVDTVPVPPVDKIPVPPVDTIPVPPVDTVPVPPVDTVPQDTIPQDTVPQDTIPTEPAKKSFRIKVTQKVINAKGEETMHTYNGDEMRLGILGKKIFKGKSNG